jgi:hypothetical protein
MKFYQFVYLRYKFSLTTTIGRRASIALIPVVQVREQTSSNNSRCLISIRRVVLLFHLKHLTIDRIPRASTTRPSNARTNRNINILLVPLTAWPSSTYGHYRNNNTYISLSKLGTIHKIHFGMNKFPDLTVLKPVTRAYHH